MAAAQRQFTSEQDKFAASLFGTAEAAKAAAAEQKKANQEAGITKPSGGGATTPPSQDRIKKALEVELKAVEVATLRREVVLENFRAKGEIDEERYQDGLLAIQQRKYQERQS